MRYLIAKAALALAVFATLPPPSIAAETTDLPLSQFVDLAGGVTVEFVLIRPGHFVMGADSPWAESDEAPAHEVTLTRAFYFGRYEVTQQQWIAVMGSNPSRFRSLQAPVESVSWNDSQQFLRRLAALTHRHYALPTEAQWEYACRAGTTTQWFCGDSAATIMDYAWIRSNAASQTHRVGTRRPNPWGLYDMCGNVWEWCSDWYEARYHRRAAFDPIGPASGDARIVRGGAWGDDSPIARSGYRNSMGPDVRNAGTGFRCVLLVDAEGREQLTAAPRPTP